jgi:hypothetical protein
MAFYKKTHKVATGQPVNYTGGKIATDINVTGGKFAALVNIKINFFSSSL